ncbi:MAG TPA: hypothetical protein VIX42_07980 [Edaphobacter sp.]
MADLLMNAVAVRRAADVLLRGVGGRSVMLRLPAPASAGDITEQLGLAVPEFQDVELAPVVLERGSGTTRQLLVSPNAVNALVGSMGYSAASVLFADAFGVLVDGVLMEVESVTGTELGGAPAIYRLALREPIALRV